MSQPIRDLVIHIGFLIIMKNTNLVEDVRSCFQSSFNKLHSEITVKKSKVSQPMRGWGGHLGFLIDPKNTDLVEDVEILLPVKFLSILFSNLEEK